MCLLVLASEEYLILLINCNVAALMAALGDENARARLSLERECGTGEKI